MCVFLYFVCGFLVKRTGGALPRPPEKGGRGKEGGGVSLSDFDDDKKINLLILVLFYSQIQKNLSYV